MSPKTTRRAATFMLALAVALTLLTNQHLQAAGRVVGWGDNFYGQITPPADLTDAVAVAAGLRHALALRANGTVVAWGENALGQTDVPPGLANVTAIATKEDHCLALRADGTVVAWGSDNERGQNNVPADLTNAVWITTSGELCFAGLPDGRTTSWGYGGEYASTGAPYDCKLAGWGRDGTTLARLTGNGNGRVSGGPYPYTRTYQWPSIVDFDAGRYAIAFLHADGTVIGEGEDGFLCVRLGLTNIPPGLRQVVSLAMGVDHALALRSDGTVIGWGANDVGQATPPGGLSDVEVIAAGGGFSLAIVGDGSPLVRPTPYDHQAYLGRQLTFNALASGRPPLAYQWQRDGEDLPGATNAILVLNVQRQDYGRYRVVVSNALGTVIGPESAVHYTQLAVWGTDMGVLPPITNAVAIAAGYSHGLVLRDDATVQTFYQSEPVPTEATNVVAMAGSGDASMVLRSDGSLLVWRAEVFGAAYTNIPPDCTNIVAIDGFRYGFLAQRADGNVFVMENAQFQPHTTSWPDAVALDAGYSHYLVLHQNGTVDAIGDFNAASVSNLIGVAVARAGNWNSVLLQNDGHCPSRADATNLADIAVWASHTIALRQDGTVFGWDTGWGQDQYKQVSVPADLRHVQAIATGRMISLALVGDGTPGVCTHPYRQWAYSGEGRTLRVWAAGEGPLEYQWFVEGNPLADATNRTLTLDPIQPEQAGGYSVRVSNTFGAVTSRWAALTVVTSAPIVTAQPTGQVIWIGQAATFQVETTGSLPQQFQWCWNGSALPGETQPTLTLPNLPTAGSGHYAAVIQNAFGVVTSDVAVLTVKMPPADALDIPGLTWIAAGRAEWFGQTNVTHDGVDAMQTGPIGDNSTSVLEATVTGPGTLTFWWKVSSESGADLLKFYRFPIPLRTLSGEVDWRQETVPLPAGTWRVAWWYTKNLNGAAGQDAGWLDEVVWIPDGQPPVLILEPVSQSALGGTAVTLTASATGTSPLTFSWLKNGLGLPNATSPELAFPSVVRRDSGSYSLVVSNQLGVAQSSNAVLTVRVPQLLRFPELQPDGTFTIGFADADGQPLAPEDATRFTLLTSTNLIHWTELTTSLVFTNGALQLRDPTPPASGGRFYRVVEH